MELEECKAAVHERIGWYLELLGVGDWKIEVEYRRLDSNTLAECIPKYNYKKAVIAIDIDKHSSAEEVHDSLRHELIHVLLAAYEPYRQMSAESCPDGIPWNQLEVQWAASSEQTVWMIEQMLNRLDKR